MLVSVSVQSSESVDVMTVRDHTAVETVSVGVGAVMVSYSVPLLTVSGGRVLYFVLEEKTVKVAVEVGKMDVTVVFTAGLAVAVMVGASALRFCTFFSGGVAVSFLARCRSKRARACSGSTARGSLLFQWMPGGSGIRVGLNVAQGSGKDGLGGIVQEGVTVSWITL